MERATLAAQATLARGLFVPAERWGWEFVDGGPPTPSPVAEQRPVFTPPRLPDLRAISDRRDRALRLLWVRMLLPVAFGVLLAHDGGILFVPAGFGLAVLTGLPVLVHQLRLVRARRRTATITTRARAAHDRATAAWQAEVSAHDRTERRRRAASSAFHPITAPASTPRVDVFGGDGDGWASLLATAGASLLASGTGVLLVDLSERTVGGGLARLAGEVRCPVESWDLPGQLDEVRLLAGLGPREAGELVADAFEPTGTREPDPHRRALHADLISAVTEVLGQDLTFSRLAEGLRVLEGLEDGTRTTAISPAQAMELVGRMNAFGRGERIPDELRYLRSSLRALCPPAPAGATDPSAWDVAGTGALGAGPAHLAGGRALSTWWPVRGLRVIATSSRTTAIAHKELADRLVVQALLRQLRRRIQLPVAGRDLVVVAGADGLGRPVLTALARQAETAGTRLVLLFERLADDTERLLGSQGASTIIMRLGNGKDATTAAEFIGRGHRFVLSQVTAQVGRSFTAGDSDSVGTQDGTSDTTGTSGGSARTYDGTRLLPWLQNSSTNTGWQESVTTSRSRTWQRTVNTSVSDSTTDGETSARVYEFLVEPTTVQTLPTTAFLLVSAVDGPGRVAMGDCNPGTVLLPGVSPVDRDTAARSPDPAALPAEPARAVESTAWPTAGGWSSAGSVPVPPELLTPRATDFAVQPAASRRDIDVASGATSGASGWVPETSPLISQPRPAGGRAATGGIPPEPPGPSAAPVTRPADDSGERPPRRGRRRINPPRTPT
ncbi:hypothetical protein [Candidatus Frankia nodulisporulans]|uniref:hypothetical protein n=1 Tax=Candidatus Frankia nodulisporulans TaxID=2060052 RepID=UPI0015835788|nr:hypothetical protein [Candidatus Frankia nodulisporulans]